MICDDYLHGFMADRFLLGLLIYREAAGEPLEGKVAVAYTVLTRAGRPGWWGEDVYSVITAREQYSSISHLGDPMTVKWPSLKDRVFQECLQVAGDVLEEKYPNPAPGADHYCTVQVASHTPWVNPDKLVRRIGNHCFYNLGGSPSSNPQHKE